MGAKVTARTSDGTLLEFEAADGETILDAAAGAGSTLVSLCRKGTCGVCRVRLVTGDVNHTVHTPRPRAPPRRSRATYWHAARSPWKM